MTPAAVELNLQRHRRRAFRVHSRSFAFIRGSLSLLTANAREWTLTGVGAEVSGAAR